MSDFIKTPASFAPSEVNPIDIVHAYRNVLHARGANVAQVSTSSNAAGIIILASFQPTEYIFLTSCKAKARRLTPTQIISS